MTINWECESRHTPGVEDGSELVQQLLAEAFTYMAAFLILWEVEDRGPWLCNRAIEGWETEDDPHEDVV